jgi:hypothetical protein
MSHSTEQPTPSWRSGGKIMDLLVVLAVLVAWVVLQVWVLPRFGVKT